jgi:hypothetical protein
MNTHFAFPASPGPDPVPWLTETWERAGCFALPSPQVISALREAKERGSKLDAFSVETKTLATILDTVRSTVASIHDDPHTFGVQFGSQVIAMTEFDKFLVTIGSRALSDESLTNGQRAAILTGLALHETGHVSFSLAFTKAIEGAFGGTPDAGLAFGLANVGEDNRIERLQRSRFGGLIVAHDTATWYVSKTDRRLHGEGRSPSDHPGNRHRVGSPQGDCCGNQDTVVHGLDNSASRVGVRAGLGRADGHL